MPDGSKLYIAAQDRTGYLSPNYQYQWTATLGQIGTCTIPLEVSPGDSFAPAVGDYIQIVTIDRNTSVARAEWGGVIQQVQINWNAGNNGQHELTITGQSLEVLLSNQLTPQAEYQDTNAGAILTAIFGGLGFAITITLGRIDAGVSISDRKYSGQSSALSDLQQLATDSGYILYIDYSNNTLNFHGANARASALVIGNGMMVFGSIQWLQTSADFRDTQAIQLQPDTIPTETAVFVGDGSTTDLTLPKGAMNVVAASVVNGTTGIHATATGTFSGQPANGDTVTIGDTTYTFKTALDNTVFGEVLIGATDTATCANLVDAINRGNGAGSVYSLPTWTNQWAMAGEPSGSPALAFTLTAKTLGTQGNTVTLGSTSSNFSWSVSTLGGGVDLGGVSLRVGPAGAGNYDLSFTPWSDAISTTLPVQSGKTLVVTYKAVGANILTVGNGASAGLGVAPSYQIMSSTAAKSLPAALAMATAALAKYSSLPSELQHDMDFPGVAIGQYYTIDVSVPAEAAGVLNGNWIPKQVQATGWSGAKWWQLPEPYGHFRYTINWVNSDAISTYVDTLNQLLNSNAALLATMSQAPTVNPSAPAGSGGSSLASSVASAQRTLTLEDLTVGNDIAPHVCVMTPSMALSSPPEHAVLNGFRILAVLRKTISVDLQVRINKITDSSPPSTVSWTITIPAATPVNQPLEYAINGSFADADILTADVLASDGSKDVNGIVTYSVEWV